jgi:hypothetical protein
MSTGAHAEVSPDDISSIRRAPKSYEEYAWVLVFIDGLVFLIADLWQFIQGPLDPTPAFSGSSLFFQTHLLWAFGFSLMVMALAMIPYRRWETWAWALLWLAPLIWLGEAILNISAGGILWPILFFAVAVAVLGLLLPVRMFVRNST